MRFQYDDGGRAAAGFRGDAGDCVTRAVAIATRQDYLRVYNSLNALAKSERTGKRKRGVSSARNGVYRQTIRRYLEGIGWIFTPTMGIGTGCKVHLRDGELPMGRLIVTVSKHECAVINGVITTPAIPRVEGHVAFMDFGVLDRQLLLVLEPGAQTDIIPQSLMLQSIRLCGPAIWPVFRPHPP